MWVMWSLVSVRLETVLVSVQDRCTVYAKCATGVAIVLGVPNGTLVDVGQVEVRSIPFGDSGSLDAR